MPKPFLLPLLAAGILTAGGGGTVVITQPEAFDSMLHSLPGMEQVAQDDGASLGGADATNEEETREEAEADTELVFQHSFTGGPNVVHALNRRSGHFELQGRADYVRAGNDQVAPGNEAFAYSSCIDCQTLALALQLTVYQEGANVVRPVNAALAYNENCSRCLTIARAIQYVIPVPDLKAVPREVRNLIKELDLELKRLEKIDSLQGENAREVEANLNSIIARFESLRVYLEDERDEQTTGTTAPVAVTPAPQFSPTPTSESVNTPSPAATPVPTATP